MPKKLYRAISFLKDGTLFDLSLLTRTVDAVIVRIHMKRYPFAWELLREKPKFDDHEDRLVVRVKKQWFAAKDQDQLSGGAIIVEIEDFRESCWKKLLNRKFQERILAKSSSDDSQTIGFMYIAFKRVLQEKIYELMPGIATRIKQINRVLKNECREEDRKKGIWILHSWSGDPKDEPAGLDDLRFVGQGITPPAMHHSDNPDSNRGPSIPDKEMRRYLTRLLAAAGGMAWKTALIDYIKEVYGLMPIRTTISPPPSNGKEGPDPFDMIKSNQRLFLGREHYEMAEAILRQMTLRQKTVYYHHVVLERKLEQTARIIGGIGTTTAHNEMKEITKYAKKAFSQYAYDDPTEATAVMDLLGAMIKKELETHGPNR